MSVLRARHLLVEDTLNRTLKNAGDTKDTPGLGKHRMVQDLHYTGDDTKLHRAERW